MGATDPDYHLHQSYRTRLEPLGPVDAEDVHALSVAVNWPHRPQDIRFLLQFGGGFIARDQIRRPLGAGMQFDYAGDAAMVGMMMTHPKLQSGGLGREILTAIESETGARKLRLNATKPAWRLYHAAGFRETGSVVQYQGICRPNDSAADRAGLRPASPDDLTIIERLDQRVFGADRKAVLSRIFAVSQVYVSEQAGQVTGFAMCRRFGRGHLVGPLVAACEDEAIALTDLFLTQHRASFVRLDADARHTALGAYLDAVGLERYDTVVPMTKGAHYGPENAANAIYALASQALG